MFINNINPVLFTIGPFAIKYYGLVYALGFILAYVLLRYAVKKGRIKLTYDAIDSYLLWLIVGVVVGARLFEIIFYEPSYYFSHPLAMFMIWNGGMSFHGGLAGVILVTYLYSRKYHITFYDLADVIALPAALALAIGRIANYTNSELVGTITDPAKTPWCVVFQRVDQYCRHPSQLYESITHLFTFSVLLVMRRKKSAFKKGTISAIFLILYGALRFLSDIFRDDPRYLGISMGQFLSILTLILGIILLWNIHKKD